MLPFAGAMLMQPVSLVGITLGNLSGPTGTGINASANNQVGAAYQAAASGTLNFVTIIGETSAASAVNYRLCIYGATSQTVWSGALLGQTAVQNGLGVNQVKKVALVAGVSVVAGNWYALTIQTATTMATGHSGPGVGDRFFSDTYSDGALATAGASAVNSSNTRCISASEV